MGLILAYTLTFRAFSSRFDPRRLTTIYTHIHTPMAESTSQGDSQLVGSGQGEVRDTSTLQIGGVGDRTGDILVTVQPALPPELSRAQPTNQHVTLT